MNGPFGNGFPYTNFHELNMDWIIKIAKDFLDQYTHIQDIISSGETSLQNTTAAGIEALQAEKTRLEGLLDAWYTEHSADIASELASALSDFQSSASAIVTALIATIPEDYTELSYSVQDIQNCLWLQAIPYACNESDEGSDIDVTQVGNFVTVDGQSTATSGQSHTKILLCDHIESWNSTSAPATAQVYPLTLTSGHIYKLSISAVSGTRDAGTGTGSTIVRFISSDGVVATATMAIDSNSASVTYTGTGEAVQIRLYISRLMTVTDLKLHIVVEDITISSKLTDLDSKAFQFRGNLADLSITDMKDCRQPGWYTATGSYLENVTDLPEWFPATSAIILRVYTKMGNGSFIRQELQNYNGQQCARIITNNGNEYYGWYNPYAEEINILMVGNSFTRDENGYLPALLKEALPDINFHIGILYHANATLSNQVTHMNNNTAYTYYDEYSSTGNSWTSTGSVTLSSVINKYKWDLVTFTQAARGIVDYETDTIPQLHELIDGYTEAMDHNVQFALFFAHVYATHYEDIPGSTKTSAEWYEETAAPAYQAISAAVPVEIIPTGTAVQNARTTDLDLLGSGTYKDMTGDGRHLQQGVCCLVPAYVGLMKVMELIGKKKIGCMGSQIRPDDTWITAQAIPGVDGSAPQDESQGVTEENCILAAKCAIMAVKYPYTITDCSDM